ncbi:type I restriction endonuclease subunit R [Candidatus Gracilibacteria bacterium 28_42_T64]|nr:type I restriction endonuclease subunit R [Candidatus Gracilibacteria bacterium 28_42_T64]
MNKIQSEAQLENNLISQLQGLEYDFVTIKDEKDLLENLKKQIEIHNFDKLNGKDLSEKEFKRVLNHLDKGNVFERAKILRDKMPLELDSGDKIHIEFINSNAWCQNEFQVTNQITMEGSYENRYDVTLLINGLPLVAIELKRRGLELKEAFNQIGRYHKHSFWSGHGLFKYIQIFVISNGVNTKYFSNTKNYINGKRDSFKQTFFWADEDNKNITKLDDFTNVFLEPCHLSKMITKYIVLSEADNVLMVLRPYQYYAVEKIIDRVKNSDKNGYIWHTTGSGKTLTSFKTSQILRYLPEVKKVVFVVDRKDLDYQTTKEFNSFSEGSIDGTDNTTQLVKQFSDTTPLIVTTIQKLNTAISKEKYLNKMELLKDEKVVFIFDECHRSQFGDTHDRIVKFFNNHQMFGFTGTPILAENNNKGRTTADLFGDCLHKYVITDAIRDENVLKFSIEYINTFKTKKGFELSSDEKVEDINTSEIFESPERLDKVTDYILNIHNSKTHSKSFTAMFCVSNVDTLIKYYESFKRKDHNLKIATIFSYGTNEEDLDADGILDDVQIEVKPGEENKHTRDKLDEFIVDYNKMYGTKFSTRDTKSFYNYYNDIAKKVKERRIDILIVVNMFLTGFDSKTLNTLYVDKNLKYHGLIQAFSRTNRILNEHKSQGNIVCFRNLKDNVDDAIKLFSNKDAKDVILMEPLEKYVKYFNETLDTLQDIAPSPDNVDDIISEEEQYRFVQAFRNLLRLKNILESFVDFDFSKLDIDEQTFADYSSKYWDIYDKVKVDHGKEKVSILDDIDFELELLQKDEINIDYILGLLATLVETNDEEKEKQKKNIIDMISGDIQLRSKKELIQKFMDEYLGNIKDTSLISSEFEKYMNNEKLKEFEQFCKEENIDPSKLEHVIGDYVYTGKIPLSDDIAKTMIVKPKLIERKTVIERIKTKMTELLEKFDEL